MADSGHCIVIGAGVAGLSAARRLRQQGISATVVDKGRNVGGRMATRRIGEALCDHGAQVISARGPEMICTVDEWRDAGIVRSCRPIKSHPTLGEDVFFGVRGMNTIAAHMARGLDVRSSWHATTVGVEDEHVVIHGKNGETLRARGVLLTPPMPQSLALLDAGGVFLDESVRSDLQQIAYSRCITLLAATAGDSKISDQSGVWLGTEPIQWIGDNHKKGLSTHARAITIHSGPEFAESHWDADDNNITNGLLEAAYQWIGDDISEVYVHRWRYAHPVRQHAKTFQLVDRPGLMAFAGDGFAGQDIEGALLSGIAAANALTQHLKD